MIITMDKNNKIGTKKGMVIAMRFQISTTKHPKDNIVAINSNQFLDSIHPDIENNNILRNIQEILYLDRQEITLLTNHLIVKHRQPLQISNIKKMTEIT